MSDFYSDFAKNKFLGPKVKKDKKKKKKKLEGEKQEAIEGGEGENEAASGEAEDDCSADSCCKPAEEKKDD